MRSRPCPASPSSAAGRAAEQAARRAAAQEGAQALEAGLVDLPPTSSANSRSRPRGDVEGRLPVPEGAIAVGHALELHGGDVALHRQRGVEDAVGRDVVVVGEREKLLADVVAVLQGEIAHAAHLVGRLAVLDRPMGPTAGCQAVWLLKSRRIAQTRSIGASMMADRRTRIMTRRPRARSRPTARRPSSARRRPPGTRPGRCARDSVRLASGAQSNSAHHSAKVRLPSVTGVSLRVAT